MSEIKPPPNWCPTCDKRPNDPEAVFCSDSFHRRDETRVADILTRVSKALPVLRNILANGKLAGADIAQEMLDDINAILARTPQPVTPAGGEVVAYRYVADDGAYNPFVRDWLDGKPDRLDLENIARHPGVRFEFAYSNQTVPDHELQQKWFRRGWDMYVELHGETHPPVADAALPRGHRVDDGKQLAMIRDAERLDWLEQVAFTTYRTRDPETGRLYSHVTFVNEDKAPRRGITRDSFRESIDAAMQDAALNQRGGGSNG